MRQIKAVIRPEKLQEVREALDKIGYTGIMITEIEGHGNQKGIVQQWRGEKYRVDLLPKVMIDIVVKDEDVKVITDTIMKSARTGDPGDGKIFVFNVDEVIRIRTGETGEVAL